MAQKIIALDLETTGLNPRESKVRLIQMCIQGEVTIVDVFEDEHAMDELVELVEDKSIVKILFNAKFDLSFIRAHAGRRVKFANIFDCMLAEQVLTAGWSVPYFDKKDNTVKHHMPEYNLKSVTMKHLGIKLDKSLQNSNWGDADLTQEQMEYAARDVLVLEPLYDIQMELLKKNKLTHVAQLEMDVLGPIIEMELTGLPFDFEASQKLLDVKVLEEAEALKVLEVEVRGKQKSRQVNLFGEDTGSDVKLTSPAQIKKHLQKLGYECDSSDVETLRSIDDPFCAKLLKYRGVQKSIQFLKQFEDFGGRSGRLYPGYNQNRAATGRMSSSKFNLQQTPKRGENAVFRGLFKAQPGMKIVKADYSAVELRSMAHAAGEREMIKAIENHIDLHKLTASGVAGVPIEEVTKAQRQSAKAIGFGLIFGMGAETLQKYAFMNYGVRMSSDEAVEARNKYFELYKDVANWQAKAKNEMRVLKPYFQHNHEKGFFVTSVAQQKTAYGRIRFWPNFAGESEAKLTEYLNSRIQGGCADLTKLALIRLYNELPEDCKLIAVIHDECVLEVPEDKVQIAEKILMSAMTEEGCKLFAPVKIEAESNIGDTWG